MEKNWKRFLKQISRTNLSKAARSIYSLGDFSFQNLIIQCNGKIPGCRSVLGGLLLPWGRVFY